MKYFVNVGQQNSIGLCIKFRFMDWIKIDVGQCRIVELGWVKLKGRWFDRKVFVLDLLRISLRGTVLSKTLQIPLQEGKNLVFRDVLQL